ncbi:ornithine cyclodeaminase [Buchananella felis]|uniref:ornithine cyclodeaminase n=1 Tax=Buchananella felis TaxID=3231492 RepID=UPI003528AD91
MRFVNVENMRRWLAAVGPEAAIAGLVDALEKDFARWEQFELRPRVASHTAEGVIELMPTTDGVSYGFKFVNGHPSNPARGFQTVTAFGVLADVHNGYPRFEAEMTLLTALRTAATTGLAAKYLAPAGPLRLGMVGAGSQSEFQVLGMRAVRQVESVTVFDVDPAASSKMRANLAKLGTEVRIAESAAAAVAGCNAIITCTADKRNATVLSVDDVAPGTHVTGVGGDCPGKTELDERILDLGPVFVEYTEQTRIEGEIQAKPADFPVTELWEVITGRREGRTSAEQVTIFDSVGFAVEDFCALRYLEQAVEGTDFFEELDLIADPEDPKDLFGMIDLK